MFVIKAPTVNHALNMALYHLMIDGVERPSRNGPVLGFPTAVSTVYTDPTHRVIFSQKRNANPTFHLWEALWMLAGRNDVKFPAMFVKNMKNFSDDTKAFWGAYGHRWRRWFGWDQIAHIIHELKRDPSTRRAVMSMWDATGHDADFLTGVRGGKDVPCNTHIYFDCRGGVLNMLVSCRSNDIIWGAYGANAVHMSILQEYVAHGIGMKVGTYTQMSNDLHLYTDKFPRDTINALRASLVTEDRYLRKGFKPTPLLRKGEYISDLMVDIEDFFNEFDDKGLSVATTFQAGTQFMRETALPMLRAWALRGAYRQAMEIVGKIEGDDWRTSMGLWLEKNWSKA